MASVGHVPMSRGFCINGAFGEVLPLAGTRRVFSNTTAPPKLAKFEFLVGHCQPPKFMSDTGARSISSRTMQL